MIFSIISITCSVVVVNSWKGKKCLKNDTFSWEEYMILYALVGKSGTGKSYQAMSLAYDLTINYMIDDGVLIGNSKKIAGRSAKSEKTRITAVKRAIFYFEDHKEEVKYAIKTHNIDKLLIIGTSDKMVRTIAKNLAIDPIDRIIYIDEISSEEDIQLAKHYREKHGKHIIPLPTLEIKKDFSGYFLDTIRSFISKKGESIPIGEKTVVRPTFSYMGNYTISNDAIDDLIKISISRLDLGVECLKVKIKSEEYGVHVTTNIQVTPKHNLIHLSEKIQRTIKAQIEELTRINILSVNIHIVKIIKL